MATNPNAELPARLVDIITLADMLGVTVRHVRRLVAERRIPFIRWSHLIRFDPAEIREWINEYRKQPGRPARLSHTRSTFTTSLDVFERLAALAASYPSRTHGAGGSRRCQRRGASLVASID